MKRHPTAVLVGLLSLAVLTIAAVKTAIGIATESADSPGRWYDLVYLEFEPFPNEEAPKLGREVCLNFLTFSGLDRFARLSVFAQLI